MTKFVVYIDYEINFKNVKKVQSVHYTLPQLGDLGEGEIFSQYSCWTISENLCYMTQIFWF